MGSPRNQAPDSQAIRWHLSPAGEEFFGGPPADYDDWPLVVVKANRERTIATAELPAGGVFVKISRVNTLRTWARERLRGPKARLEFDQLLRLARNRVPTVEPLAWGRRGGWPSEGVLVTRRLTSARSLAEVLAAHPSPHARRTLANLLGRQAARWHAAGVLHPDPHPGNVLVTDALEITLTDVHDLPPLVPDPDWATRRDNLVLWNRYFQLHATRPDRMRFWHGYRLGVAAPADGPREVEALTEQSNLRFWTRRLRRPLRPNRDTAAVPGGFAARVVDPDELARWTADPAGRLAELTPLAWKDSASATVAPCRLRLTTGEIDAVVKCFKAKSLVRRVKSLLRPTPAGRAWVFGHNLLDRGLPTPRPLLYLAKRRGGLVRREYVVFERVPDCLELPSAVRAATHSPHRRKILNSWATCLGRLLRTMHARQVSHRDLKSANILMSGTSDLLTATPVLIDLVGVTVGKPVPTARREKDLTRLAASFLRDPAVTHALRLQLLREYLGPQAADWKRWWHALDTRLAAKQRQNHARNRPLA